MPTLTDIPLELLLHNLRPLLTVRDLLSLAATNRCFANLAIDESFWKHRVEQDFGFFDLGITLLSGWEKIYERLRNPEVFVWGHNAHGRLGNSVDAPPTAQPYPIPFKIPRLRIREIVAGGWSFHALNPNGDLYVWGALNGEAPVSPNDDFSFSGKATERPLKLALPAAVRSVSCCRAYSTALDSNGDVWTFMSWGKPYRIISPHVDGSSPETTPVQLASGSHVSFMLMASGDVFLWDPFGRRSQGSIRSRMHDLGIHGDMGVHPTNEGVIPCVTWGFEQQLYKLPRIPSDLPNLPGNVESAEDVRLIKIVGLMGMIVVGLTNMGHILTFAGVVLMIPGREVVEITGNWTYLEYFSNAQKLRTHPVFTDSHLLEDEVPIEPPQNLHITHLSANYTTFAAYTTGPTNTVLIGNIGVISPGLTALPEIIPSLQNYNIKSIVMGDAHFGAVTRDGKIFTWGRYHEGALGLGDPLELDVGIPGGYRDLRPRNEARDGWRVDPPNVLVPTEVTFNRELEGENWQERRDLFCVCATAGGWHTGTLVIDLEGTTKIEDKH